MSTESKCYSRGKSIATGELVYGWYRYDEFYDLHEIGFREEIEGLSIPPWSWIPIHPDSQERSTGKKDDDKKEIYSGDIIRFVRTNWDCPGHPQHKKNIINNMKVYWSPEKCAFRYDLYDDERCFASGNFPLTDDRAEYCSILIIGNTTDNPKSLKVIK